MKYKQKLKMVEAFQYEGDFSKLSDWFLKNSTHSTLPFFYIGRELQVFDKAGIGSAIIPGHYLILSTDKRTVDIMSKDEFESSHSVAPYRPRKEEK